MSRATRKAKEAELARRLEAAERGEAQPVPPPPCPRCKATGRVWVRLPSNLRDVLATPCPSCRPEASHLTHEGRVKSREGLEAAAAARARGL